MPKTKTTTQFPTDSLIKIKQTLTEEKEKLENELAKFAKPSSEDDSDFTARFPKYGDKEDENAAEVADYVVNLSLQESLEKTLRDVHQALERLTQGQYGICKYCGKTIEEKRLLARPTSSSCMTCKKAITQEV